MARPIIRLETPNNKQKSRQSAKTNSINQLFKKIGFSDFSYL